MPRLTPEQRLERAIQQEAKAKEQRRRAKKALREQERKKDTRRKIILGGKLLDMAGGNKRIAELVAWIVNGLERPADRAAFEGFELPRPEESR